MIPGVLCVLRAKRLVQCHIPHNYNQPIGLRNRLYSRYFIILQWYNWYFLLFRSSGLFNAKTCQSKGVSYGLLETAFIDDKDDMEYYNKNKEAMAKAVANALVSYFK